MRDHFPLLRYFSLASLILILLATVALSLAYRYTATQSLIGAGTRHNVDTTQLFFNALWPELMPYIREAPAHDIEELKSRAETGELQDAFRQHARGTSALKIKVFDLQARTIFSSDLADIGTDASGNAGYLAARAGEIASELTYRDSFSAFEGAVEKTNVLSTYIPVRSRDGEIQAVFELYDDVTPLVNRIGRTQVAVTAIAAGILLLLYAALFLVVRRADRILGAQQREIRRHLAALESSERRFRDIAEAAGEYIFEVDREGRYTFLSGRVKEVLGYRPDELLGRAPAEHMPPGEAERVRQWFAEVVPKNAPFRDLEHRTINRDGSPQWVLVSGVPVLGPDGEPLGYRGTVRDITRRKAAEAAVIKARDEARAASQAKSIFLANMSHEFRTPMNAIVTLAELILTDEGLTAETRENLESVSQSARALLATLTNILEFVELEAGTVGLSPAAVDPRRALEATLWACRQQAARKGVGFEVHFSEHLPAAVPIDAVRLRQAVAKLLDNAVKFSEKGTVRVAIDWIAATPPQMEIVVRDAGVGITPAGLERLFEPFRQIDDSPSRRFGGVGLGLAICWRLAQLMGGRLSVDSELGRGSVFRLTVPVQAAAAHAPA